MELLELFIVFAKIGFTSFGGMSMVPLIHEEMIGHGWMTQQEVADILAIAEMTPGPLGMNCATFAGTRVAGIFGGLMAVLGVLMPAFSTTMLVAAFYQKFKEKKFFANMLYVIRPICMGLILAVIGNLIGANYLAEGSGLAWNHVAIGLVALVLLCYYKRSIPLVISICGLLGVLLC